MHQRTEPSSPWAEELSPALVLKFPESSSWRLWRLAATAVSQGEGEERSSLAVPRWERAGAHLARGLVAASR